MSIEVIDVTPQPFVVVDVTPQQVDLLTVVSGPPGPPGPSVAVVYDQLTPRASWTIPHTLGRRPLVEVYVGDEAVDTDVFATAAYVTLTFPAPTVGQAVLS